MPVWAANGVEMMVWRWVEFSELTAGELYELLKLRQDVFIIEQACVYPELDGLDVGSLHLLGRDERDAIVAYLRIVPPGARYDEPSIGRLVTRANARGEGLGRVMMEKAIDKCRELYPGCTIRIQAQEYLVPFYTSLGFSPISAPYDEAEIMHVDMVLQHPL